MGVRGLTGYIARHAELFLKPHELHDCNLIIDGDNLACNLYKDVTGTFSAFGGDYDDFYRCVLEFFHVLAECNVCAYVLMDGGYESKKLRTVAKRLRGKITVIKRINPCGSATVFPTMMKEVFVDAVRDSGVPIMRCVFEADDELAALGRKLNCPVLSYDSDFYIYNVRYIPLITLTVKAHTKRLQEDGTTGEETRKLRKNEAKHVEKNTRANKVLGKIQVDNVEKKQKISGKCKTYKYMDCCMYRVENLIARRSLSSEKMPLFAALLGNDYIARSAFRRFFANGLGRVGRSRKGRQQHNRIRLILQWLKEESSETALEKILGRLKKRQRESLRAQVQAATCGYSNEVCHSYEYFKENYENAFKDHMNVVDEDEDLEVEEDFEDEELEEDLEDAENEEDLEVNEEEDDEEEDDEDDKENENEEDELPDQSEEEADDEDDEDVVDKSLWFPSWFLKKLYPSDVPRYCVDLLHLRKYINSPQIEHFPYSDCNEAALPILIYIFTLLHSVDGVEVRVHHDKDGTPLPLQFTYMTRCTRVTNIQYLRYGKLDIPHLKYEPGNPDPQLLRYVFTHQLKEHLNVEQLFAAVPALPSDLRLYFLSIVYWLHTSVYCDLRHLHSLVVCLIVLRTIDAKVPAERDMKAFQKRYGKIIKKESEIRTKEATDGVKRGVKPELMALSVPDRMPYIGKSDCYLVMNRLLKHFHMQEIFKKKYDSYSSSVLHSFSQLQSVVLHMHTLNALLGQVYESPHMGQLFCGVFLYNLYDLMNARPDIPYYVEKYIFEDSRMMYDFYTYLMDWVKPFVPAWKQPAEVAVKQSVSRKLLKKQRQAARKAAEKLEDADPNAAMVDRDSDEAADEFFDLNNKFCTFLKVS